jgi:hypothetical protein
MFSLRSSSASIFSAAALALLAACSDASSHASSTLPVSNDAGGVAEAGGPDAASITPRPALCEDLERSGDVVPEQELPGEPPPAVGGTILPGTYDLIELDAYRGGSGPIDDAGEPPSTRPTGRAAQVTIVVGEFSMSTVEARGTSEPGGLGPERAQAVLYRVDGASIIGTAVCPTTALPARSSFSAISESLVLLPDTTHRELYRRRP